MDYVHSSSPDPLNDSPTYHSSQKIRRSAYSTRTFPLKGSSPTKQTFELDVGNQSSPQRLIVTVEADTHSTSQAYERGVGTQSSPSRRALKTRERTITTTVPLKGLSDSEDEGQNTTTPTRARGRPRKLNGTPAQSKAGRKTPPARNNSRSRRSIGDLVDGDDEEDMDFQIGRNIEVRRGKGRSRSRSLKNASRKSLSELSNTGEALTVSSSAPRRGRGRPRKSHSPTKPLSLDDEGPSMGIDGMESGATDENLSNKPQKVLGKPSPSPQSQKIYDVALESAYPESPGEESGAGLLLHPAAEDVDDSANLTVDDVIEVDDEEDELGDLREFDTILESEEFSMISVDSVPSLRQHLSSPANQEDIAPPRSVSKSLEALKATEAYNDSFSDIPNMILEAATPVRPRRHDLLAAPAIEDNSFSSVPPQILEAATPGWKNHISKFKSTAQVVDDSFSSVALDILEAAIPGRVLLKDAPASRNQFESSQFKLDVPEVRSAKKDDSAFLKEQHDLVQTQRVDNYFEHENSRRPITTALSTTNTRLLTPDETPSPSEGSSQNPSESKGNVYFEHNEIHKADMGTNGQEVSMMHSYLPSSPPTLSQALQRNGRTQISSNIQTPFAAFSSPSLPSPKVAVDNRDTSTSRLDTRPELAPAARAGHALQQSVLVPSSPRDRSNSLGSPFKSPVSERRSSVSYPYLPSPSQEQMGRSEPRLNHDYQNESPNDPFNEEQQAQISSLQVVVSDHVQPSSSHSKTKIKNSRFSSVRSADVSTMSGSAMSWQPEQEIMISIDRNPKQSTSDISEVLKRKWQQERAAVSSQVEIANSADVVVLGSDASSAIEANDDDEGLQLLLETINSPSPAKQRQEYSDEPVEGPRRSKIPSPWRKNGKSVVYNDEIDKGELPLHQRQAVLTTSHINQHVAEPIARQRQEETPILSDEVQDVDLSGYQIPQKSNFKPRPRQSGNLDFAALLSPIKPLPVLSGGQTRSQPKFDAFISRTTVTSSEQNHMLDEGEHSISFAPIPQKAGFNPSPRKLSNSGLFNIPVQPRLFTPSTEEDSATIITERTPLVLKQTQALNRVTTLAQEGPSSPSFSEASIDFIPASDSNSHNQENTPFNQKSRTLQWTQSLHLATKIIQTPIPCKHASPTKSCFRTPSVGLPQNVNQSPSKNVVFVSSSPQMPSPSPEETLSATTWSKKHWLLLDSILISHQPSASEGGQEIIGEEGKRRRRNSTRVISKLLGRKVSSQGAEMRFEQWHLEAVDEFREKVPGWEEKVIAMRAFALLVGAERRSLKGRC